MSWMESASVALLILLFRIGLSQSVMLSLAVEILTLWRENPGLPSMYRI
jgi:hypothetical protein